MNLKEKNEPKIYKVPHFTERGLKRMGLVINYWWTRKNLSLKAFRDEIEEKTGYRTGIGTLSGLERGKQKPDFETINFIAHSGITPYSAYQLLDFALETAIPREIFEEFENEFNNG